MSRPVLDTRYDIDGDLNDTQDALDGPPAARRWGSRLLAFALAAAAIYGACRGFHRYSATTDELAEVAAVTTPPDPKKLPTADDLGGLEPQQVITTWQQQNTQRIAADRTHLWSAYALMLLCPVTLGGAALVWWRGQFKRPQGAATLDPTQLGMALTCAVMLAAVRGFDAYTLMNLDKMPPATDLKTAFYQVRDQRKPGHRESCHVLTSHQCQAGEADPGHVVLRHEREPRDGQSFHLPLAHNSKAADREVADVSLRHDCEPPHVQAQHVFLSDGGETADIESLQLAFGDEPEPTHIEAGHVALRDRAESADVDALHVALGHGAESTDIEADHLPFSHQP